MWNGNEIKICLSDIHNTYKKIKASVLEIKNYVYRSFILFNAFQKIQR